MPNKKSDKIELKEIADDFYLVEESLTPSTSLNPYDDLNEVAKQLALYLNIIDSTEIANIIIETRKISSLRKSKKKEVNKVLAEMAKDNYSNRIIDLLVTNKESEWKDTSFNTKLLRRLVKALPDHDTKIYLIDVVVFRLSRLLLIAVYERIKNEKKLNDLAEKIHALQLKQLEIEKELDHKKQECSQKNTELETQERKLEELIQQKIKTNDEIELDTKKLVSLADQANQKETELKQLEQKLKENATHLENNKNLFILNPGAFDPGNLSKEKIAEAVKIAETAFKLSISEAKTQINKQAEITKMTGTGLVSNAKQGITNSTAVKNVTILQKKNHEQIQNELSSIKNLPKPSTAEFKKNLSLALFGKPEARLTSLFKNGMNATIKTSDSVVVLEDYQNQAGKKPTPSKNPNFLAASNAIMSSLFPAAKPQKPHIKIEMEPKKNVPK